MQKLCQTPTPSLQMKLWSYQLIILVVTSNGDNYKPLKTKPNFINIFPFSKRQRKTNSSLYNHEFPRVTPDCPTSHNCLKLASNLHFIKTNFTYESGLSNFNCMTYLFLVLTNLPREAFFSNFSLFLRVFSSSAPSYINRRSESGLYRGHKSFN